MAYDEDGGLTSPQALRVSSARRCGACEDDGPPGRRPLRNRAASLGLDWGERRGATTPQSARWADSSPRPRGLRINSLPAKAESSLTSSLVLPKLNPLCWASIWVCEGGDRESSARAERKTRAFGPPGRRPLRRRRKLRILRFRRGRRKLTHSAAPPFRFKADALNRGAFGGG